MMQYFEWYLLDDASLWNKLKEEASVIKKAGIDALWLPPAYKGSGGIHDVGYTAYDLYDLGEFDQKGSIATKYGTRKEYLDALKTCKEINLWHTVLSYCVKQGIQWYFMETIREFLTMD